MAGEVLEQLFIDIKTRLDKDSKQLNTLLKRYDDNVSSLTKSFKKGELPRQKFAKDLGLIGRQVVNVNTSLDKNRRLQEGVNKARERGINLSKRERVQSLGSAGGGALRGGVFDFLPTGRKLRGETSASRKEEREWYKRAFSSDKYAHLDSSVKTRGLSPEREQLRLDREKLRLAREQLRTDNLQLKNDVLRSKLNTPTGGGGLGGRGGSGGGGRGYAFGRMGLFAGVGGGIASAARVMAPGLPAIALPAIAAYGGSLIANRAQTVHGAKLAFQMVSGGNKEQGAYAYRSYMNKANEVGVAGVDNTKNFLNLKASLKAVGMEGQAEDIFFGFAEYGNIMGVDKERMDRALMAVGQIGGKNQMMAEEVKNQLAENMPGVLEIFSKALTGGDTAQFLANMQAGKYRAADLSTVNAELQRRIIAMGGVGRVTMAAEKNRLANMRDDIFDKMNRAGLNQGYADFYRSFGNSAAGGMEALGVRMAYGMSEYGGTLGEVAGSSVKGVANFLSIIDTIGKRVAQSNTDPESALNKFFGIITRIGANVNAYEDVSAYKAGIGSSIGDKLGVSYKDLEAGGYQRAIQLYREGKLSLKDIKSIDSSYMDRTPLDALVEASEAGYGKHWMSLVQHGQLEPNIKKLLVGGAAATKNGIIQMMKDSEFEISQHQSVVSDNFGVYYDVTITRKQNDFSLFQSATAGQ